MNSAPYFNNVGISAEPPRKLETLNMNPAEGLQGTFLSASILLLVSLTLLVLAAWKKKIRVFGILTALTLLALSACLYQYRRDTVRRRLACYHEGKVVTGQVVRQEKHRGQPCLIVRVADEEVQVKHHSDQLWTAHPLGAELKGVSHNGEFFFGQEAGVRFVLFLPKP